MNETKRVLKTRSIVDADSFFTCEVLKETAKTMTVKIMGNITRCKKHEIEGKKFIRPLGNYSMSPTFEI